MTLWRHFEATAIEPHWTQARSMESDAVIADAGCGDGRFLDLLLLHAGEAKAASSDCILGVDSAIDRLVRVSLQGREIAPIQGSLAKIPLRDSSVDVVLANSIVEHCREPIVVLREIHRILKTGGMALVTVPSIHFERLLIGTRFFGMFSSSAGSRYANWKSARIAHYEYVGEKCWAKRLEQIGFEVLSIEPIVPASVVAIGDALQWIRDAGVGGSRYSLGLQNGRLVRIIRALAISFQAAMLGRLLGAPQPSFDECGAYAIVCRRSPPSE